MDKMWRFTAEMIKVIDGGTIEFEVDLGFRIFAKVRVRLLGVNTPEVYGVKHGTPEYEAGLRASEFTKAWFAAHGWIVELQTLKDPEKYGRWLGTVTVTGGDGPNILNQALIEQGWRFARHGR